MKIVLLYDQLNVGGTERLFVMIANLLHSKGHEVKVVIIKEPSQLDHAIHPAIKVVYLHRNFKWSISVMKQLASECRHADVVHLHTYYNWRYYYLSSVLFSISEPRVVLHEHSAMAGVGVMDKMILQHVDAFVAVHPLQVNEAQNNGVPQKKIFLLPNIVVMDMVHQRQHDNYKVMMVGNIRREKNYELALEILQTIPAITIDVYGNVNDEAYDKELQMLAEERALQGRFNIIAGVQDIGKHAGDYDLALHTASNETGPLVILEYLAMQMPFITSSAGQSPALVAEHLPQLVLSSLQIEAWIERIKWFYNMSEQDRTNLKTAMKNAASQLLDTEKYYQSLLSIYGKAYQAA